MKILFSPFHHGILHSRNRQLPSATLGMPNLRALKSNDIYLSATTKNVGNMVHAEAPSRMLRYNRHDSEVIALVQLMKDPSSKLHEIAQLINKSYDYLVISEANLIRSYGEDQLATSVYSKLANLLEMIEIPFCMLGLGIQDLKVLPKNKDDFDPNLLRYLEVCGKKASIIGVRGRSTKVYLESNLGITGNIQILGCPSFYLYPENLLNIKYKPLSKDSKVVTAGYLRPREMVRQKYRVDAVSALCKKFSTDYIFQDDIYALFGKNSIPYNEAVGEVGKAEVNKIIEEHYNQVPGFEGYFHYRNSSQWRMKMSQYDVFIGDRLHCGVLALQSRTPCIFFYDDTRVKELTSLLNLPALSFSELKDEDLFDLINSVYNEESIEKFKDTYIKRLGFFRSQMKSVGLRLI